MAGVRTEIVRIGNSQGIRIPKAVLEQCRLGREVILEPAAEGLLVRPAGSPRAGWEDEFRAMAKHKDDGLLDPETAAETEWESVEWEW